jgi:hypothetical protein
LISPVITDADLSIPQWHKDIVRQRKATATEQDFTETSEACKGLILELNLY